MLGVAVLLLPGCGHVPRTSTIESLPAVSPRFVELDRAFEALRAELRIPGMSVAVVENGAVTYARGFGFMDGERNRPATPETAYWIASLTKPFSAVVLLRLAELDSLDLDRRMTDLPGYPEWCASFAPSGSIFARDLDCTAPTTIRQAMSHLVQGTPGERFAYNAAVYSQLRRVAPLVSSRSWRQLMIDHVLDPAGLPNTAAGWYDAPKAHVLSNLAQPRRILDDGSSTISITPIWEVGSGAGLISTVMDIARFDMALDRGALLSPASRSAMWSQATTLRGDPVPYGLGWYVQDHEGERLIWHSGWEPNSYSGLYLKVPAKSATLVMLANSEGLWWGNPIDGAEIEKSPFAAAFLNMLWKRPADDGRD